jgi:hypothetical protein
MVARDQLFGEPFGDRRIDAAGVLADDVDIHAAELVAVLLEIELDAVIDLGRRVGELARIGQDEADLDCPLGMAGGRQQACREQADAS